MRHCLYQTEIFHRRSDPEHHFTQTATYAYLDLDYLHELASLSPLLGVEGHRPIRWSRRDYLGNVNVPLKEAVIDLVSPRIARESISKVCMLASLRTLGWCFNPIAVYWCFNDREEVLAQVLSVTNTPWHEQHHYVLTPPSGGALNWEFDKELHVSPYFPMDMKYHVRSSIPADDVRFNLDVMDSAGNLALQAGLKGLKRRITHRSLTKLLLSTPTQKTSFGIYKNAAKLKAKGARFVAHPQSH